MKSSKDYVTSTESQAEAKDRITKVDLRDLKSLQEVEKLIIRLARS